MKLRASTWMTRMDKTGAHIAGTRSAPEFRLQFDSKKDRNLLILFNSALFRSDQSFIPLQLRTGPEMNGR